MNWAHAGSLWPMTFGLACCAKSDIHAYMPRYDLDRLGIIPRASPRQSDVMIVAGTRPTKWHRLRKVYDQMPEPRWVISMVAVPTVAALPLLLLGCARCDRVVPVDVCVWLSPSARRWCRLQLQRFAGRGRSFVAEGRRRPKPAAPSALEQLGRAVASIQG